MTGKIPFIQLIEDIRLWDAMKLLSFIYGTGRIQGMREERARRKERSNHKKANI